MDRNDINRMIESEIDSTLLTKHDFKKGQKVKFDIKRQFAKLSGTGYVFNILNYGKEDELYQVKILTITDSDGDLEGTKVGSILTFTPEELIQLRESKEHGFGYSKDGDGWDQNDLAKIIEQLEYAARMKQELEHQARGSSLFGDTMDDLLIAVYDLADSLKAAARDVSDALEDSDLQKE